VQQTAQEFGVPYYENESFSTALASHYRLLRRFGRDALRERKLKQMVVA
jgi:linoleoyl-CoA desaturase